MALTTVVADDFSGSPGTLIGRALDVGGTWAQGNTFTAGVRSFFQKAGGVAGPNGTQDGENVSSTIALSSPVQYVMTANIQTTANNAAIIVIAMLSTGEMLGVGLSQAGTSETFTAYVSGAAGFATYSGPIPLPLGSPHKLEIRATVGSSAQWYLDDVLFETASAGNELSAATSVAIALASATPSVADTAILQDFTFQVDDSPAGPPAAFWTDFRYAHEVI